MAKHALGFISALDVFIFDALVFVCLTWLQDEFTLSDKNVNDESELYRHLISLSKITLNC